MIDEILENLYRAGTHKMYCTEPHHLRSIAETEDQLHKAVMEVIGEDEKTRSEVSAFGGGLVDMTPNQTYANKLRQTQRQRANKFFGEDK